MGRKTREALVGSSGVTHSAKDYKYNSRGVLECEALRMNPSYMGAYSACSLRPTGSYGADRITRYTYDSKNRLTLTEKAVGTSIEQDYQRYSYNSQWQIQYVHDANGNKAEYQYDDYGRMSKWKFPSKTSAGSVSTTDYEEYRYDLNDNRTWFRKRDGKVITYTYDGLNRMTKKNLPGTSADVDYAYDNRGLELYARFTATGRGITNSYYGFGGLKDSTTNMDGSNRTLRYRHDLNGNMTRLTHPDNQYFTYTYDGNNRQKQIYQSSSTTLISDTYDREGTLDHRSFQGGGRISLQYDTASRMNLHHLDFSGSTYDSVVTFAYNPASQIVEKAPGNYRFLYTGDRNVVGNYSVNGLNQYTNAGFSHDANGNMTAQDGNTYTYDVENRLIQATGNSLNSTLKYDPKGRLYEYTDQGTTRRFVYDGDALALEYTTGGAITHRYVHGSGIDDPLVHYNGSSTSTSSRRYLYANYQGSIVAESSASGTVTEVEKYDSFGIPSSSMDRRFGYTGQVYLTGLDMYYYKARIYNPRLGRFMQTDPIGYEDQMNHYAYVHNDPMNFVDPNGENSVSIFGQRMVAAGIASQVDSPAPGPGDVVALGIALYAVGELAINVLSESSSSTETENKGQGQAEVGDCPTCGGETSNKPGKIGEAHDLKPKEVRNRIHGIKNGQLSGNPDVEVCNDCGEVFPQTEDGNLGDSIGNIEDDY